MLTYSARLRTVSLIDTVLLVFELAIHRLRLPAYSTTTLFATDTVSRTFAITVTSHYTRSV
jgi:hypothetical protein